MVNTLDNKIPGFIEGYGEVTPYEGVFNEKMIKDTVSRKSRLPIPGKSKIKESIKEAIKEFGLKNGMTVSFHHHLRNGDHVLAMVMEEIHKLGIKNLRLAASSLFPCHEMLVELIEDGTVTDIVTSYMSGPVAKAVSNGKLKNPAIMQTHGGRARAIMEGDIHIDMTFIASPACDVFGNINGVSGVAACGALGYAMADAEYADCVVAVTDNLSETPIFPIEIPQSKVDYIVKVDSIGDPKGIVSGTTQITKDPVGLKIAKDTLKALEASGLLKEGLSFQTGAGGISLAVAKELETYMKEHNIKGSFASGGITGYIVNMMEEGLFDVLYDVQCFDLEAVRSYKENITHLPMSGDLYGNPHNSSPVVNNLDIVILGATEMDLNFNVNVTTGSDGVIMGGSGGHADTAASAKLTVIVSKLFSARTPLIKERVTTITTPGETVDILVTDRGIAINELRKDLIENFKKKNVPYMTIKELKEISDKYTGTPKSLNNEGKIIAVSQYRDGSVIDIIKKVD